MSLYIFSMIYIYYDNFFVSIIFSQTFYLLKKYLSGDFCVIIILGYNLRIMIFIQKNVKIYVVFENKHYKLLSCFDTEQVSGNTPFRCKISVGIVLQLWFHVATLLFSVQSVLAMHVFTHTSHKTGCVLNNLCYHQNLCTIRSRQELSLVTMVAKKLDYLDLSTFYHMFGQVVHGWLMKSVWEHRHVGTIKSVGL